MPAPDATAARSPLEETLLARGMVSADEIRVARAEQARASLPLGRALVQLGFVSEAVLQGSLAETLGHGTIALDRTPVDPAATALLPRELAHRHQVLPVSLDHATRTVRLATSDPADVVALDAIRAALGSAARIEPVLAPARDIAAAIERHYGAELTVEDALREIGAGATSNDANPSVARLVEALLAEAARLGASDVHVEPERGFARIRYRIDGVLRQRRALPGRVWQPVVVRLKVLCGMNVAESRAPQDGRLSLVLAGRQVEFRASSHPTMQGENLVLRLLDRERGLLALEDLGLAPQPLRQLERVLARPEGIVLVAGPTGSGKTTTLYSILARVSHAGVNVMTLEDPVEYPMALVRQSAIGEATKLDFASGIRSILRQDPDIILVGEIRDPASAEMALRAAMTGHQVFSTLHANSALGALPRLRDLGVAPGLLAGNIGGVLAQRLARRLCPHCRRAVTPDAATRRMLGLEPHGDRPIYQAVGCDRCDGAGYRGRFPILEVLRFDAALDELVARGAPARAVQAAATREGFQSLADDALRHVLLGDTSLDEAARVVDLTDRLP